MRRPKTSHLNAHQLQPRAFAECSETFCHFCIHSFVWRVPRWGSSCASVGKVCKGFRLAVFVWFTLLFCLFFCCCSCCCSCYFFPLGSKWMSQFILRYTASQVERAMQKGLRAWVHNHIHIHIHFLVHVRSQIQARVGSVWRRKVQASQNKACHSLLGIITICWFASLNTKQQKRRQKIKKERNNNPKEKRKWNGTRKDKVEV